MDHNMHRSAYFRHRGLPEGSRSMISCCLTSQEYHLRQLHAGKDVTYVTSAIKFRSQFSFMPLGTWITGEVEQKASVPWESSKLGRLSTEEMSLYSISFLSFSCLLWEKISKMHSSVACKTRTQDIFSQGLADRSKMCPPEDGSQKASP